MYGIVKVTYMDGWFLFGIYVGKYTNLMDSMGHGCSDVSCWETQLCWFKFFGQIIATSHDLTTNGGLVREIPYFRET